MGLSTKKSKSTTNQQTTATTTPTNPAFVTQGIENLAGKIDSTFAGIDPTKLIAGPNPLQTQAGTAAGGLTTPGQYGAATDFLTKAGNGAPQSIDSVNLGDYIQQFMNPFQKDVVDTALADYDVGAGQTRAADMLAKAGDSTFGGSTGALQTAFSNDAINRGRGSLSAGLRTQGFDRATSLATTQAANELQRRLANANFGEGALQRQIQAGTGLGALGTAQGANDRANIEAQANVGGQLRDIQNQQNQAPIQALLQQIAAMGGLPLDLFKGATSTGTLNGTETTKTSGMGLSDWVKIAQAAAMAASDENLKTDIETIGHDAKGRRWVSWRWKWDAEDAPRLRGVIAQEVQKTDPDAVHRHPAGFLMVDYSKLGMGV